MIRPLTPAQRRRPDWRWAVAREIITQADHAQHPAAARAALSKGHDEVVRRVVRFKVDLDIGLEVSDWRDMGDAYEIWTNDPRLKLQVECLLLGGADDPTTAEMTGLHPLAVQAYHDAFFDVRSRPDLWFCAELFQGQFMGQDLEGDHVGVQHRIAYALGWRTFVALQTGRIDQHTRAELMAFARDSMMQQLARSIMVGGGRGDHLAKLVGALALGQPGVRHQEQAQTMPDDHGKVLMEFLRSVPLRVADPTDPANLNLTAREPRAHEYLASIEAGIDTDEFCRQVDAGERPRPLPPGCSPAA